MAWSDNLFYIAFASQIFLLSYFLPNRLLARMRYILATFPPHQYPKLYPRPVEQYANAYRMFRMMSRIILLVGIGILLAVMFVVDHSTFADDGYISEAWPAFYGMLQFLPLLVLELSEYSHLRQMRKANTSSKRVAELRRRSLTDFVSPVAMVATLALYAGAVFFNLYVYDFAVGWSHDAIQRILVLTGTNLLLALLGFWTLRASKSDPHQAFADRHHRISVGLKSIFYVSMALSVFIAIEALDDMIMMDPLDAVILSVYFQVIALLSLGYTIKNIKCDDIDFEVYRSDAAPV